MPAVKFLLFVSEHALMQAFLGRLHAAKQQWVPIIDAGIKVDKGYPAYDDGIANDVFVKDAIGAPYIGQVLMHCLLLSVGMAVFICVCWSSFPSRSPAAMIMAAWSIDVIALHVLLPALPFAAAATAAAWPSDIEV